MGKGGGSSGTQRQTSVSEPWGPSQQYLTDVLARGDAYSKNPAYYYNGQLTVGQTGAETDAWQQRADYNSQVFGGGNNLNYGNATNALNQSLTGQNQLGNMTNSTVPSSQQALGQAFSPYDIGGRYDSLQGPQGSIRDPQAQAGNIGQYNFGTNLDAQGNAPQYGRAGNLDATSAYQSMLSGQPDYAAADQNAEVANAKAMRDFNSTVIPQLNQNATFTNNMTGGIKGLNAAVPELTARMQENTLQAREAERNRALTAQQNAASQVAQGGMQSYGLGLQTSQGQRALEAQQAGMNLSADQSRAQYGLQDQQLGLNADMARFGVSQDQANFGLQREQAREAAIGGYRSDALGYGALAGNLASQQATDQSRAVSQFPSIYDTGRQQGNDALAYANYDRALQEDARDADQQRFDYLRDQPMNQLGWYSNILNGVASPYGSQTTTAPAQQRSRTAGAIGGAMAGYGAVPSGSPWYMQLGGALLGGYAGYYG